MKRPRRSKKRLQVLHMDFRVGKLQVKPGDIIVLITNAFLQKEQIEAIRERLNEQIEPLGVTSMILSGGVKLGILRKANE
jgi:hypothetical protein